MQFRKWKLSISFLTEDLRSRFWLLPTLVTIVIVIAFPLVLRIENPYFKSHMANFLLAGYSPDAARLILSSISTALMTVIGVLFSITILVIQQASNQFSPRVTEIFIKARNSQLTLGFYVGTFVFCILLLRQIPSGEQNVPIPQAAISLALFLTLCCIGLLVQYVHFIAHSIQSTSIIRAIVNDTVFYLTNFFAFISDQVKELSPVPSYEHSWEVKCKTAGYFEKFYPEKIDLLLGEGTHILISAEVGDYFQLGDTIAVINTNSPLSETKKQKLQKCFKIGSQRTHAQDFRFGTRQLVDIALRGLSPGINDPSTAIEALHGIETVLHEYVGIASECASFTMINGTRMSYVPVCFRDLFDLSFRQITSFAEKHPTVLAEVEKITMKLQKKVLNEEWHLCLSKMNFKQQSLVSNAHLS